MDVKKRIFKEISKTAVSYKSLFLGYEEFKKFLRLNLKGNLTERDSQEIWNNSPTPESVTLEPRVNLRNSKMANLWVQQLKKGEITIQEISESCKKIYTRNHEEVYKWIYFKYLVIQAERKNKEIIQKINESGDLTEYLLKRKKNFTRLHGVIKFGSYGAMLLVTIIGLSINIPYWNNLSDWKQECKENAPIVYVTNYGGKYHKGYHYKDRNHEINLFEAAYERRYSPCNVCKPIYKDYRNSSTKPKKKKSIFNNWFGNLIVLFGISELLKWHIKSFIN